MSDDGGFDDVDESFLAFAKASRSRAISAAEAANSDSNA
jgi:hypothetical protein